VGNWSIKAYSKTFLAICEICGVQDIGYTFTGKRALALPELLDGLNPIGQEHAKKLLEVLIENPLLHINQRKNSKNLGLIFVCPTQT